MDIKQMPDKKEGDIIEVLQKKASKAQMRRITRVEYDAANMSVYYYLDGTEERVEATDYGKTWK